MNIDDEASESSIKMYTLLNREDVESLIDRHRQNPGSRELQKTLAYEVTRLVHGDDRARADQRSSEYLFGAEQVALDSEVVDVLSEELPVQQVGTSVVEALVSSGFTKSKGEARRLIEGGAVSVNGKKTFSDQSIEQKSLIKKGKNSFILVI